MPTAGKDHLLNANANQPIAERHEGNSIVTRTPCMFDGQVVLCIVVSNQSTLEPSAEATDLNFRTKRLIAVQLTEAMFDDFPPQSRLASLGNSASTRASTDDSRRLARRRCRRASSFKEEYPRSELP